MGWEQIGVIIGAVFGSSVLAELVKGWTDRKKSAEDFSLQFLQNVTLRVEKLERELETIRKENVELHREVASLRTKLELYEQKSV